MKHKDYDDDLLVELLARGEMSYGEIGRRVGLDKSMVGLIARGQTRPDLQEKINARTRKCLAEKRSRPSCGRESGGAGVVRPGARKKDYDDDLLVDLIARGEMSYGEIAERIGLARQMVGEIARGENRPDLQDRINTRMRNCLADRRRRSNQCLDDTGGAAAVRHGGRNKQYDDDLLVELIARGDMSHARIGKRIGLSASMVGSIINGQSRRDLLPRIAAMARGIRKEAHRLGARWLRGLLTKHIREGLEGTGEFARRCRKDLIDKLFDPELLKEIEGGSGGGGLPTPGLTDEDYEIIAQLKGAPPDDDEEPTEEQP